MGTMTDDWKPVGLYEVVNRPEYNCSLQEFRRGQDQMMFIHQTIHKFTKETLKLCKSDFSLLRQHVTCPLYAVADVDDEKWSHFVKLFGFKFLQTVNCTDGKMRRLFIHIKDDKKNVKSSNYTVVSTANDSPVVRPATVSDDSVQRRTDGAGKSAGSNPSH